MNTKPESPFNSRPLSFWDALILLFVGLKLTGHITWSWFWVLSPITIPFIVAVVYAATLAIAAALKK
jgi:hypothetical protein